MTAAHARAAVEVTGSRHDQPHAAEGDQAAAAWAALGTALGSHLDREEHEVLPLPGRRVTAAEREPVAKYFVRALGPRRPLAHIPGCHQRPAPGNASRSCEPSPRPSG